jgi:hypothetical protein
MKKRNVRETSPLKTFMLEKTELRLVGDDDSGPEDALDDLDLECVSPPLLRASTTIVLFFQKLEL